MTRASRKKPAKAAGKTVSPAVKTGKRSSTPSRELAADASSEDAQVATLVRDLGQMIDAARRQVAVAANAALTTLYWQLGHRVRTEVLEGRRAEYGVQIVAAVGRQLEARYGRGFGEKNLRRMMQFAEVFPDSAIVAALLRQLGWTHFTLLLPLEEPLKREFYAEMCRIERWSTRELRQKIDGMLYERTALSKKPEALIHQELAALREKGEVTPGPGLPGPVHARLPPARRHLQREGSRVGIYIPDNLDSRPGSDGRGFFDRWKRADVRP